MKYPYHIEYTEYGSPVMVLPQGMELVTTFLLSDIRWSSGERYLSDIDRVLRGELSSWRMTGNACHADIKKDFSQITDIFAHEGGTDEVYTIETSELREIIVIWLGFLRDRASSHNDQ